MATAYKAARQAPSDWGPLDGTFQRNWLKERNQCGDANCLLQAYKQQIHFIEMIVPAPPISGTYQHTGWCVTNYGSGIADAAQWGPCDKDPVNTLQIKALDTSEYAVWFEFTSFASTPSYCRFSGIFSRNGDRLELSTPYKALACKLKIHILKDKFVFEDEGRTCHEDFCDGHNLSIDKYEFSRNKK
ncbi:hypothetical protein GJ699_27200 [Duganella sp. FT80W]|uniref:Uncharacterized protein n=1 Tax=Duganella guangzhouensis TaxID=2666084 RepID=A0A6I2L8Y8_9BURK|nr:hypothetical protein [Duganella guangzhouensis]MRW93687.1 hypothetical protein [Duganella guangzhouensis]